MEELNPKYGSTSYWEAPDKEALVARHAQRSVPSPRAANSAQARRLMAKLPKLEIVSCLRCRHRCRSTSRHARTNGIRVTNTPDVLTERRRRYRHRADLGHRTHDRQAEAYVRSGSGRKGNMPLSRASAARKLGIVGMGRVGSRLAKRARRLRHVRSPISTSVGASDLALIPLSRIRWNWPATVEFLIVTLAGGESTRNIVDARRPRSAWSGGHADQHLARQPTVDEAALLGALELNALKAARRSTSSESEPKIDPRFLKLGNVVLQPHHASGTVETRKAMGKLVRDNLAAHFGGQALLTPVL